jgi:PAS domain S-box-containing protein
MARSGSVRRRQAGVLLVGATEPEVGSWLHAAGHATRTVARADAALTALGEEPADLVIADREPNGLDVSGVCLALREDPRLGSAWLLAVTTPTRGGISDVGADDYLHRPFTRVQLLARARTGLRAVHQRDDDALLRSLMATVPGAIYRSAWHADHRLELITDEIERISGYPADNFIASSRRTLMSIIHPDDQERVKREVATASDDERPFAQEYRIVRADGEVRWVLDRGQLVSGIGGRLWMDGVLFDITERRAAEEALRRREIEAARTDELRASRTRIVAAADAARRKIERDLHDGAQQRLVSLALDVNVARSRLDAEPDSAGPFLDRLARELSEASAELRELARGIHPAVLNHGLKAALVSLASRASVPTAVSFQSPERLPEQVELAAYFVACEALANVAKYAHASTASVRVSRRNGMASIEIADDGVGGADETAGTGLQGLADRVAALDGTLRILSPLGAGTVVTAELPCGS